ncbi:MAG: S1 RNA-binding domain-containing protein [Candidatus Nanoarchaeia archaeon]|jgi:translation initiation factor 2 subunit 1
MFKKKGLPEVGELVLCTVKRLSPHSAFVDLDEYERVEGMLHIGEVALRGVKNIKDHLSVNKKIVCKILRAKPGEVDVSLKRVNSGGRKQKLNESRIEKRFYHLVEHACKEAGDISITDNIITSFVKEYGNLYNAFEALRDKGLKFLDMVKLPDNIVKPINDSFNSMLQQLNVSIKKTLSISSVEGDGVNRIKELLNSIKSTKIITTKLSYLGSNKFLLTIESTNYKTAEEFFNKLMIELVAKGKSLRVLVSSGD